nr:hypothetical protein [uncultured bacterium]
MMTISLLALLASTASGLLAGALVTEACVLVPYWKKMPPEEFVQLHPSLSPLLFRFYAPLTIVGTSMPVIACATQWAADSPTKWFWTASAVCGVGLIGFYFSFFRQANIEFANDPSPMNALVTLNTWATVHLARTLVAVFGFVFAGLGIGPV